MKIPTFLIWIPLVSLMVLNLTGQEVAEAPAISVSARNGPTIPNGGILEVGSVDAYSQGAEGGVTVRNSGTGTLRCQYEVTGQHASEFVVPVSHSETIPEPSFPQGAPSTFINRGITNIPVKFVPQGPRLVGTTTEATLRITSNDTNTPVYEITLRGRVTEPLLSVEQPAGQPLVLPMDVSFGEVVVGAPKEMTFTLRNRMNVTLRVFSGISFQEGSAPYSYEMSNSGLRPLEPGATTQVTVKYTAHDSRERLAKLWIEAHTMTNPRQVKTYLVNLSGRSVTSKVGFESPVYEIFQGQPEVAVRLRRTTSGAPASVMLTTETSAASAKLVSQSAVAGRDYIERRKGPESVVRFALGETVKDVVLKLPASSAQNLQLTLRLSEPSAGTEVDPQQQTAQVLIINASSTRLTLTVPDASGMLNVRAVPAAGPLVPKGDVYPKSTLVKTGAVVTLAAVPRPNHVFHSWLNLPAELQVVSQIGDTLSFIMPAEALEIGADFAPSPFAAPAGQTPGVHLLLKQELQTGVEPKFEWQGYLSATLTASGGLSGKLLIAGQTLPVVASLYADSPALFTVAGQKRDSLPLPGGQYKLRLENNNNPSEPFRAVVSTMAGSDLFTSVARRAVYSQANKVPASLLNSPTKGYYTFYFAQPTFYWKETAPQSKYPTGSGYATLNLTHAGQVTMVGMLADNTPITMSTTLVSGDVAPVFVQLPAPGGTARTALVTGEMVFAPDPLEEDLEGSLLWFRPATSNPKVRLYPEGWQGISLGISGGLYNPALNVQTALDLGPPATSAPGNAQLVFSNGSLSSQVRVENFNVAASKVVKMDPTDSSFTLTLAGPAGLFTGTFTPNWPQPATAKTAFRGVIVQKPMFRVGFGFFISNAKEPAEQESGVVFFGPP